MSEEYPDPKWSEEPNGVWSPSLGAWDNLRQTHRAGGLPNDPRSVWLRVLEVVVVNLLRATVVVVFSGLIFLLVWLATR